MANHELATTIATVNKVQVQITNYSKPSKSKQWKYSYVPVCQLTHIIHVVPTQHQTNRLATHSTSQSPRGIRFPTSQIIKFESSILQFTRSTKLRRLQHESWNVTIEQKTSRRHRKFPTGLSRLAQELGCEMVRERMDSQS